MRLLGNKDLCSEIFRDLMSTLGEYHHLDDWTTHYKKKVAHDKLWMSYNVLNNAIKLKAFKDDALLNAISERIRLAKEIFVMGIESINPTRVPCDLKQDNLPYSMRYYDAIMAIA